MPVLVTGIQPARVCAAKGLSIHCLIYLDPRDKHGDDDGERGSSTSNV
ncbi:integrase [Martelella alba]|uniref:Integrase n=1 Tax=Martelella alba TaxID=2590451 RepID=A0A506UGF5_9HYPH|nr:integrase [Martelella alba]